MGAEAVRQTQAGHPLVCECPGEVYAESRCGLARTVADRSWGGRGCFA
ncbi:MAG: hypothetical protein QM751_09465 [Paludibacteraceae bacterium]